MSTLQIDDLPGAIRAAKRRLRAELPNYREAFLDVATAIEQQVVAIERERLEGKPVIPEIPYSSIASGTVDDELTRALKARGACVVRGVFDPRQVEEWDRSIGEYLERNNFADRLSRRADDKYFGELSSSKPQIYGIYWSKPQVEARQSPELTKARVFLNHLWTVQGSASMAFDPDHAPVYADRLRRRPPGSKSLGLSPHCDGGSVERWLDENFRRVYRHVFGGDWKHYDPFDAAFRTEVREIPSPAVCSMFRTFQGWTALTRQGPGNGTLQLVPIANAMSYLLLRALQDDVPDDELCGAQPGRALSIKPQWHRLLLRALSSIPLMQRGDAVFWHSDVIHAVEDEHRGDGWSNVMYIAALPACAKNDAYLSRQLPAFLEGKSPPDFAADDFEVDFAGRATAADLTALGKEQLGLERVQPG